MAYEKNAFLGITNNYGPRELEQGIVGELPGNGAVRELTVHVAGETLTNGFIEGVTLPAGALPLDWSIKLDESFGAGTVVFSVGTEGSEAANGLTVSGTTAVGTTTSSTFSGTWGASLAAETLVGISLDSGTADATAGQARLIVRYVSL